MQMTCGKMMLVPDDDYHGIKDDIDDLSEDHDDS